MLPDLPDFVTGFMRIVHLGGYEVKMFISGSEGLEFKPPGFTLVESCWTLTVGVGVSRTKSI